MNAIFFVISDAYSGSSSPHNESAEVEVPQYEPWYKCVYSIIQSLYLVVAVSNLICNSLINYVMFTKRELSHKHGLHQVDKIFN